MVHAVCTVDNCLVGSSVKLEQRIRNDIQVNHGIFPAKMHSLNNIDKETEIV